MGTMQLSINGVYKDRSSNKVRIATHITPEIDKFLFDKGYRFLSDQGDAYLPDGRFDVYEYATSLDIVEEIETEYLLTYSYPHDEITRYVVVRAPNPEKAVKSVYHEGISAKILSVHEMLDVTPAEFVI